MYSLYIFELQREGSLKSPVISIAETDCGGKLTVSEEAICSRSKGLPQFGHATATEEISFPQSIQGISAMCVSYLILTPCYLTDIRIDPKNLSTSDGS